MDGEDSSVGIHFVNCTKLTLNETQDDFKNAQIISRLLVVHLITGSFFGTVAIVLNLLALIVFIRIRSVVNKRKAFHLIFIYLSVMEIIMNYGQIFKIFDELIYNTNQELYTVEHNHLSTVRRVVRYSSITAARVHRLTNLVHDVLRHVFYWSRNWWVTLLALTRAILATKRTKVVVNKVLSTGRVTFAFATVLLVSIAVEIGNRVFRGDKIMLVYTSVFHSCVNTAINTSTILVPSHARKHTQEERRTIQVFGAIHFTTGATVPFLVIAACTYVLWRHLHHRDIIKKQMGRDPKRPSTGSAFPTRMVFVFVAVFFTLEIPRALMTYFSPRLMDYEEMYDILSVLSLIDSCANVFIYYWNDCVFSQQFKTFYTSASKEDRRSRGETADQDGEHRKVNTRENDDDMDGLPMLTVMTAAKSKDESRNAVQL